MKTKEEISELKEEVQALSIKLAELDEEELKQVAGGAGFSWEPIIPIINPISPEPIIPPTEPEDVTTLMKCTNCPYIATWGGKYEGVYDCPLCHSHTLVAQK